MSDIIRNKIEALEKSIEFHIPLCDKTKQTCKWINEMEVEIMKEQIKRLYGLQDTLRDIEKSGLFNHIPFEEYASNLDKLFDLLEENKK